MKFYDNNPFRKICSLFSFGKFSSGGVLETFSFLVVNLIIIAVIRPFFLMPNHLKHRQEI